MTMSLLGWLVKSLLVAALLAPTATSQQFSEEPPRMDIERLLAAADPSEDLAELISCPGVNTEASITTFLAVRYASIGYVDNDIVADHIDQESRILAALNCDPFQRWASSVSVVDASDVEYAGRDAESQYVIFRVRFRDRDMNVETLLDPEGTPPDDVFTLGDADESTCPLGQLMGGPSSPACQYNFCYCALEFFLPGANESGTTEEGFLQGLNDDLDYFRNRTAEAENECCIECECSPIVFEEDILPNLTGFLDVQEFTGYSCDDPFAGDSAAGEGFYNFTLDIECVDVCSLTDATLDIIEEQLALIYNFDAFVTCNGAFPRIVNATIANRDSCGEFVEPSDSLIYEWEIEVNYVTSDLNFDLFESSGFVRNLEEARVRRDEASRNLYAFYEQMFFGTFCFCPAFGPTASSGPTLTLDYYTELVQREIDDILVDQGESDARNCERVVCEELSNSTTYDREIFTTLYLSLDGVTSLDNATLDLFEEDCKTNMNNFFFNNCPEQYLHIESCTARRLFDESSTSSAVLVDNRFVLEMRGTAFAYPPFGFDFCPFQSCDPPSYERDTSAAEAADIFGSRNLALPGHLNRERKLEYYFQDSFGENFCFCDPSSDFLGRPDVLPNVQDILPPFGDVSYVEPFMEDDACPNVDTFDYEQDIYVAVDNPGADFSSFPQLLQSFFNDYTVGRIDYTCTPGFPFVYQVQPLADTGVTGVLGYKLRFLSHTDPSNARGILFDPSALPFNLSTIVDFDRRLLGDLKLKGIDPHPYPRRLRDQPPRDLQDVDHCWCDVNIVSYGSIETPSLLDLNTFLNLIIGTGDVIPGLTKLQILSNPNTEAAGDDPDHDWDPSVEIFERDYDTCPDPDAFFTVYFGLRLNQTEEPSSLEQFVYSRALVQAYASANIRKCDRFLHRSLDPNSATYLFFDERFQVALFKFDGSSRGLPSPENPSGPQPVTEPPEEEEVEESRRLAVDFELVNPFCTIDQIVNGFSVTDDSEQCASSTRTCGDCGIPEERGGCSCEPCNSKVEENSDGLCSEIWQPFCASLARGPLAEFCALPCVCPFDGCYCSIEAEGQGGPTEEEVLTELLAFLDANDLPVEPFLPIDGPIGERMLAESSDVEALFEYEQVNCSSVVREIFNILVTVYINKNPCLLSVGEIVTLENLIKDIINQVNSAECEPSFTRVVNVTYIDLCDDEESRLLLSQEDTFWGDEERRLNNYGTSFDVYLEGDSSASADFCSFEQNVRRSLSAVEYSPVAPLAYYEDGLIDMMGGDRRLVTQNTSGEVECYCPIHRNGTGGFITTDRLVFEFNLRSNNTQASGALAFNGSACENATIVEVATFIVVTLPKPPSQYSEEEKQNLTSAFLESHNNQTLENCGPGAILIDSVELVEFPFVGDDADPTSTASSRRRLGSSDDSNNYAFYVTGSTDSSFDLGGGGPAGGTWYGQSNVRRRLAQEEQRLAPGPYDLRRRLLHGRKLETENADVCSCAQGPGTGEVDLNQIVDDINNGQEDPLIYSATEADTVPCSGGVVYEYEVVIEYSDLPTEQDFVITEQIFIATANYQSTLQCPEGLWVTLNFTIDRVPLNETTRRLEHFDGRHLNNDYLYGGDSTVLWPNVGGGGGSSGDTNYNWPDAGNNRRLLAQGAMAHPLPGSSNGIHFRHLSTGNGVFIGNNTEPVNCTCANVTYVTGEDGNVTVEYEANGDGVDPEDINDLTSDILQDTTNQSFGDLTVLDSDPTASPTGSPTTASPTGSPTPEPSASPTGSPTPDPDTISYSTFEEDDGGGRRRLGVRAAWGEWADCAGAQDPENSMLFRGANFASAGEFSARIRPSSGFSESCIQSLFDLPIQEMPAFTFDFYAQGTAELVLQVETRVSQYTYEWVSISQWQSGVDGFYRDNTVSEDDFHRLQNLILPDYDDSTAVRVRFIVMGSGSSNAFYLDNIRIQGFPTQLCPVFMYDCSLRRWQKRAAASVCKRKAKQDSSGCATCVCIPH